MEGPDSYEYWRKMDGGYFTIPLGLIKTTERTVRLKRDGFVVAWSIMFFSGNCTISPFVLLTAIVGFDALIDINFVDAILPDASSILQKWPKEPNDAVKEEFAAEVRERMLDAMPNVII